MKYVYPIYNISLESVSDYRIAPSLWSESSLISHRGSDAMFRHMTQTHHHGDKCLVATSCHNNM